MKKKIFSLTLAFSLFFGIASNAFAAAYIYPPTQSIKGSHRTASWDLSWSGGSGYYTIYFKPDQGITYKVINPATKHKSQKYSYEYILPKNVAYDTYYPSLLVVEHEDPGVIVGTASARVYQSIY